MHWAQNTINALTVTVARNNEPVEGTTLISVGHVKATLDAGGGVRPFSVVLESRDFAEAAANEALQKLTALQVRYETIEKLAPV